MKLNNELSVDLRGWSIGPHHDPYSAENLTIKRGEYRAERYSDGLGQNKVEVWRGDELIASREWFHEFTFDETKRARNRCNTLYANLIVRKYLGISCDDATSQYHEDYEEDPMGSPSSYI